VIPAVGVAIWLSIRGLYVPAAVALSLLFGLGILVASAGVLGMEGALVEPGSEALVRAAKRTPPKTSRFGRAVAILVGCALAATTIGIVIAVG
jgi:hypothetical protein